MLETKLEVLRTRAEEVSTGEISDAQANLLRQIETLQTQYAIASENWQGIEGTLLSRVSSLEKERDELSTRESQIRKKAREVVSALEMTPMNSLKLTPERTSSQNGWRKSSKHRLPGYVVLSKTSLKARSKWKNCNKELRNPRLL